MSKACFDAALFEGHKGVTAVDPEDIWGRQPAKLAPRRNGWLVKWGGTVGLWQPGRRQRGSRLSYAGFTWSRRSRLLRRGP